MCLIVFGFQAVPDYPLIVAANRDEWHRRPAAPLHEWENSVIIAGKDKEKGGTWMGATKTGRFAAVTNVRQQSESARGRSRGELVKHFLETEDDDSFLQQCHQEGDEYGGYNFIGGDVHRVVYATNQNTAVKHILSPGIYGVSNASLDTPWPKTQKAKAQFAEIVNHASTGLDREALFELLSDKEEAVAQHLPQTGVDREWEKKLSPIFINMEEYGTRAQTVFSVHKDGEAVMTERSFGENGQYLSQTTISWTITNERG
ncbi:NRDE family protein [Bacillus piscicola]|uniref:NRDE family protein n=1 Tax=Bacillus piscicola TaxID=1632684 RepID=UPI001F089A3E|nr:NRDE family protein [Bacillus piscicola]